MLALKTFISKLVRSTKVFRQVADTYGPRDWKMHVYEPEALWTFKGVGKARNDTTDT
jgi:hypothetical protein